MSLFGQNKPTAPGGGLFGGNTGTTGSAGGLFSNTNTAGNTGGLGNTNTTGNTGGLFSNNSGSTGLFGAASNTNTANPAPANTANTLSTLNTNTAPSTLNTSLNTSLNGNSSVSIKPSLSTSSNLLKDLLESAHNLPKPDNLQLGSIHLTLNELQRKSQRKNLNKDTNFTKAHYLLAASGISAEEIESELNSISLPSTSSKRPSSSQPSNLENYLSTKKHENILNTIEQSLSLASTDFDKFISANISIDWRVRRDELRKSIGLRGDDSSKSDGTVKSITWNQSIPGNYNILAPLNSSSPTKHISRDKFEKHAKVIYQLNEARLENKNFPLGLNFVELNKFQNDLKSNQIAEAWKILIELTNEKFAKLNQEQKFYELYQNNTSGGSLNRDIIKNSRTYLESEFLNYVEEIHLKENTTSSTNVGKISYFINKIVLKNDSEFLTKTLSVNGTPIWALVFYLIRAGLYNDALELTLQNRDLFNKFDSNFPVYLKKFVEDENHSLPSDLSQRLHNEFNQQFQFVLNDINTTNSHNFDPYKYSVYKIIGKCDLSRKSLPQALNLSIEDWTWFHLSIINEFQYANESTLIFENYTLLNLQNKVISLGPKNFNSSSNNPLYLKTLVLLGLYELAVQYAYDHISECDAVHLAIGFNYYGLLKVSSFNKNDIIIVNGNDYEINFSRLIGSYTRTFKISDPKVACQYLILIAISKGGNSKEEVSKCHEALRELILISREFSMLLGELNELNGSKIPGILERQRVLIKLNNLNEFHHQIIEISAVKCEEEGRIFDALLLYQLCQEFDTVISLVNRLLAEILAATELDKPIIKYGNYEVLSGVNDSKDTVDTIDNNIILLAKHLMKIFNNNSFILDKITLKKKTTCDLLLPIIDIRDLFLAKDWNQVILQVSRLGLIPVDVNDDLFKIRSLSELIQNNNLDDSLIKVIPSLLIIVMTSISQLNYSILTKRYQALGNEREELDKLRKISKNCMIYAGMVQYKMPRETYSLLISLESLLA